MNTQTEQQFYSTHFPLTRKVGVFHSGGYSRESIEVKTIDDLLNLIKEKDCKIIIHHHDLKDAKIERMESMIERYKEIGQMVSDYTYEELAFYKENDIFIEVYDDYRE
jgi:hypothetical protein